MDGPKTSLACCAAGLRRDVRRPRPRFAGGCCADASTVSLGSTASCDGFAGSGSGRADGEVELGGEDDWVTGASDTIKICELLLWSSAAGESDAVGLVGAA